MEKNNGSTLINWLFGLNGKTEIELRELYDLFNAEWQKEQDKEIELLLGVLDNGTEEQIKTELKDSLNKHVKDPIALYNLQMIIDNLHFTDL